MNRLRKPKKLSEALYWSGAISLVPLLCFIFYAWVIRHFLGMGYGSSDVSTLEEIGTIVFFIGVVSFISGTLTLDFSSASTPNEQSAYRYQLEEEMKKHGIELNKE